MAINSVQQRMAAMNPACPWRGALVRAADLDFTPSNRAAAVYHYFAAAWLSAARDGQCFAIVTYLGEVITNPSYDGAIRTLPG